MRSGAYTPGGWEGCEIWFSVFCPLQGTYALGTWWLSNMMYFQAPTAGNSVFGPFMTSFVVILGHSEPGSLGGQGLAGGGAESGFRSCARYRVAMHFILGGCRVGCICRVSQPGIVYLACFGSVWWSLWVQLGL